MPLPFTIPLLQRHPNIVLLGDDGFHVYASDRDERSLYAALWSNPDALSGLSAFVREHGNRHYLIAVNLVEQFYRRDQLARVSYFDHPKVLQRKLDMLFPGVAMRGGIRLGHSETKTLQEPWIFAALPSGEMIDTLSAVITGAGGTIKNICLMPFECRNLLRQLAEEICPSEDNSRWLVLITRHEMAGIRQIISRNGELSLTRLTQIPPDTYQHEDIILGLAHEFAATQSYLTRLGYTANDRMDVIVITDEASSRALAQIQLPVTSVHTITPADCANLLRIPLSVGADPAMADEICARYIAKHSNIQLQLLPEYARKEKKMRVGFLAGVALFASSLIWQAGQAALDGYHIYQAGVESNQLQNDLTLLNEQVEARRNALQGLPATPLIMEQSVKLRDKLENIALSPMPFLATIQAAMPNNARIVSFTWQLEQQPGTAVFIQPRFNHTLELMVEFTDVTRRSQLIAENDKLIALLKNVLPTQEVALASRVQPVSSAQIFTGDSNLVDADQEGSNSRIIIRGPMP